MKKDNSSLSILLLTYNSIESTKKCIDALYKYTANFNLIIVDNASTDGTIEYLKKIRLEKKNIVLSFQKENLGIVKGRNHAYKKISYNLFPSEKYIFFLDNDQEVHSGWQQSYMEFFEQGYDIVGKEAWLFNNDLYPYERLRSWKRDSRFSYVGAGGMMIKREVIDDIGLFDERYYQFFEDPHFCWTAHEAGYKIGWNYNPVIAHNHKGALLTKKTRQYFTDSWKKFREEWEEKKVFSLIMEQYVS